MRLRRSQSWLGASFTQLLRRNFHIDGISLLDRFPEGLEDSSKYPNLFAALLEDEEFDWTEEDLAKLANGNVIRVMREMEAARDKISRFQSPRQVSAGTLQWT